MIPKRFQYSDLLEKVKALPFTKDQLCVMASFLLGSLMTFTQAPYHFVPLWLLGWGGLFKLTEFFPKPFVLGWSFGTGYFFISLYWIHHAFDILNLHSLGPVSLFCLALFLGSFKGVAFWRAYRFSSSPLGKALLFAVFWGLSEWIQGHMGIFSFPWGFMGYSWNTLPLLQITSYTGIYGFSLLTAMSCAFLLYGNTKLRICVGLFGIALYLWGNLRIAQTPTELLSINMRMIQSSIPQNEKFKPQFMKRNFDINVALSQLPGERPLNLVIWPETALPYQLTHILLLALKEAIPPKGALVTGAVRYDKDKAWNSLFVFDEKGHPVRYYDKNRLVPFAEYTPYFKGLVGDFEPGKDRSLVSLKNIPPFMPLICYEVVFPGDLRNHHRASWILNLTNDAWYKESVGPYQHLHIAKFRSIEEGLPLVRSTNNGISAVIDPHGKILYQLGINQVGFMDFQLPKALDPTFYSRRGDVLFWIFLLHFFLLAFLYDRRRPNPSPY